MNGTRQAGHRQQTSPAVITRPLPIPKPPRTLSCQLAELPNLDAACIVVAPCDGAVSRQFRDVPSPPMQDALQRTDPSDLYDRTQGPRRARPPGSVATCALRSRPIRFAGASRRTIGTRPRTDLPAARRSHQLGTPTSRAPTGQSPLPKRPTRALVCFRRQHCPLATAHHDALCFGDRRT